MYVHIKEAHINDGLYVSKTQCIPRVLFVRQMRLSAQPTLIRKTLETL